MVLMFMKPSTKIEKLMLRVPNPVAGPTLRCKEHDIVLNIRKSSFFTSTVVGQKLNLNHL